MIKKIILFVLSSFFFITCQAQAGNDAGYIFFTPVAPFKTINDGISFSALSAFWNGNAGATEEIPVEKMLVSTENEPLLSAIFGSKPGNNILLLNASDILNEAVQNNYWAILPFEQIEPRWKVLYVDGASILSKHFDSKKWPLSAKYNPNNEKDIDWNKAPVLNRKADKLTTLVLTGVTAMVRYTSDYMRVYGPLYPASLIREPLVDADILHINNEVPFAKKCVQTPEFLDTLHFCSPENYMDLLKDIGTDVVELDGDHFQDFGDEPVLYTLDLYDQAGMKYYGGGHNKKEAQRPLLYEHNGNKFAFIGCNGKEIGYAAASDTRPGAVHCDMDLIESQIKDLVADGYLPIMTFQHQEVYQDEPVKEMHSDFEKASEAGAVIVSGSQSHIPMGFEMKTDRFIHFGLGNLFFDQAFYLPETANATIDRHYFYDGKYIGTEFLTIKFTNCALSRFMTSDERNALLDHIFSYSTVE